MFSQKIFKSKGVENVISYVSEGHFKIRKGNAERGQGRLHFSFLASL